MMRRCLPTPRRGRPPALRRAWLLACVLGCAMALAACGRKAAPQPAGPPNEITWPKTYPTH